LKENEEERRENNPKRRIETQKEYHRFNSCDSRCVENKF